MFFTKARQADRFKANRTPQPDQEFVARCGFDPGGTSAVLALTVRRVIGECGSLEPTYIRDDDRWPEDLGKLDFWDSIDLLHFIFSVERAVGKKFRRNEDMEVFFYSGFSVCELVREVVNTLEDAKPKA